MPTPAQRRAIAAYRQRREAEGYRHRRILVHDDDWQKLRDVAEKMRNARKTVDSELRLD